MQFEPPLVSLSPYQQQTIPERTVISDWSKAPRLILVTCLVVWKFSLMASGAQFVMTTGDSLSPLSPVDSLGTQVLQILEMQNVLGEMKIFSIHDKLCLQLTCDGSRSMYWVSIMIGQLHVLWNNFLFVTWGTDVIAPGGLI